VSVLVSCRYLGRRIALHADAQPQRSPRLRQLLREGISSPHCLLQNRTCNDQIHQRYANCLMSSRSRAHMVPPKSLHSCSQQHLGTDMLYDARESATNKARGGGHGYVHTAPIAARDTHLPDRGRPLRAGNCSHPERMVPGARAR
jgi:hypothetical protein